MSSLHLAIVLTVALFGSGCTRRQQDFTLFAIAVAAEVAKVSAAVEQPSGSAVAAPDPDSYRGPSQAELERAHHVAMELTRVAAHDARTDNCAAVVRTSHHVRVIDPAVFANVFLRDPPIQHCLAFAPAPVLTSGVTVIQ